MEQQEEMLRLAEAVLAEKIPGDVAEVLRGQAVIESRRAMLAALGAPLDAEVALSAEEMTRSCQEILGALMCYWGGNIDNLWMAPQDVHLLIEWVVCNALPLLVQMNLVSWVHDSASNDAPLLLKSNVHELVAARANQMLVRLAAVQPATRELDLPMVCILSSVRNGRGSLGGTPLAALPNERVRHIMHQQMLVSNDVIDALPRVLATGRHHGDIQVVLCDVHLWTDAELLAFLRLFATSVSNPALQHALPRLVLLGDTAVPHCPLLRELACSLASAGHQGTTLLYPNDPAWQRSPTLPDGCSLPVALRHLLPQPEPEARQFAAEIVRRFASSGQPGYDETRAMVQCTLGNRVTVQFYAASGLSRVLNVEGRGYCNVAPDDVWLTWPSWQLPVGWRANPSAHAARKERLHLALSTHEPRQPLHQRAALIPRLLILATHDLAPAELVVHVENTPLAPSVDAVHSALVALLAPAPHPTL